MLSREESEAEQAVARPQVTVIPREQHAISRKDISENALKVMYRLNKAGYEAWLVGGGVRDLLLGKKPKDFDVTTNATPEQVRKLFRNCRLVGRRFRLAHVMFGPEIIEVATFRGHHEGNVSDRTTSQRGQNGMLLRDNIFGSIEEDAQRRDFTINSLYYSVADFTVRDYVGGMKDLKDGVIRLIGNPETRYREDPVRMLRAVRFAAKLGMRISPETAEPIPRLATLLNDIPPARLFEESLKLLQAGYGYETYKLLCEYHLFQPLAGPETGLLRQSRFAHGSTHRFARPGQPRGRNYLPGREPDAGLLQEPRGHSPDYRRKRLAPHRRPGHHGRSRKRHRPRTQQEHAPHRQRAEHLPGRNRKPPEQYALCERVAHRPAAGKTGGTHLSGFR